MSKRPKTDKLAEEEAMILGSFLRFAERSEDEFARFLLHCGIDNDDINFAGDVASAILEHYRRPGGGYDRRGGARLVPLATDCSPRQGTQA